MRVRVRVRVCVCTTVYSLTVTDEPEELPPSVSTKKVASTSLGTAPRELGKSPPQDGGKVGDKGSPRKAVLPEVAMATEQQWPPDTRVVDLSKKELTEVPERWVGHQNTSSRYILAVFKALCSSLK